MRCHPTSHQISNYVIVPIVIAGAIAIALGIWFIVHLNKQGRPRRDSASATSVAGVQGADNNSPGSHAAAAPTPCADDIQMPAPVRGVVGKSSWAISVDKIDGSGREGEGGRRLGTTTTIEAGPPPWR